MKEVFISIGGGWQQFTSIKYLQDRNVTVLCMDQDIHAPGMQISDEKICVNIKNSDDSIRSLEAYLSGNNVKFIGVASFLSDVGQMTAAKVAEKFNIQGPSIALAEISTRKDLQRKICKENGIRMTKGKLLHSPDDIQGFHFPVVIKPTDSAGSRGVYICSNAEEVHKFFELSKNFSTSGTVLVEEFVKGTEYSVETLWYKGEMFPAAISERILDGTSARGILSVKLPENIQNKIFDVILSYHRSIGFQTGVSHTELFVDGEEVIFSESACRGGGFGTSEYLAAEVSGCNINEAHVAFLVEKFPVFNKPKINSAFCALYFIPATNGTFLGIDYLSGSYPSWLKIQPLIKSGTRTVNDGSDGSRVAIAVITADSEAQLKDRYSLVNKNLKAKYEIN